jgi:hypothetical protein
MDSQERHMSEFRSFESMDQIEFPNIIPVKNDLDHLSESVNFVEDGFVVAHNVFPEESIDSLYCAAMLNFTEVHEIITSKKLSFGVGIKNGFKEIVQRHPMRYEMPFKMNSCIFDVVLENLFVKKLVSTILKCDDYIVANRSLVVSLPGCSDQSWHSDGPHMSATTDLPCHCLNVFVPLVDIDFTNGPTEFRPGSQFYTRDLAKYMLLAKLKKTLRPVNKSEMKKGSILLVGTRASHQALFNHVNKLFFCPLPSISLVC